MRADIAVEAILRRDRIAVLAILGIVIVASWGYLLAGAGTGMSAFETTPMSGMAGAAMTVVDWSPGYALIMFLMWWVMMIAMMLPSATPMILLFSAVNRRQRQSGNPHVPTTVFTATYLLAWAGFSLAATAVHWYLDHTGLLSPGMAVTSRVVGAGLLLAAGLYQLTPVKQACLRHCRLPAIYLAIHWRPGIRGAVVMGLRHGVYCLGCCWFLMLLLFFGGVMNLYWIAGLAVFVLLEKTVPAGHWLDYGLGLALMSVGCLLLVGWILPA